MNESRYLIVPRNFGGASFYFEWNMPFWQYIYVYLMYSVIIFFHEIGHGFFCKYFGGKVGKKVLHLLEYMQLCKFYKEKLYADIGNSLIAVSRSYFF